MVSFPMIPEVELSLLLLLFLGFAAGVIKGFVGVGGGFLVTPFEIVNDYKVRGIYPGEKLIKKIGLEQNLDYILIGKISSTSKKNNPLELVSMKASEVEVRIRLINAGTGRLKQVIHRQLKVEDSVNETINEIFLDIVNRL